MSYEKKTKEKLTAEQMSSLKKVTKREKAIHFERNVNVSYYETKENGPRAFNNYNVGKNTIYIWLKLWKTEGRDEVVVYQIG